MEHFRYYLRQNLGNPEDNEVLWRDRSAIHYVGQLGATLLIVHGVNDPRCPIAQARSFRDKLLERRLVEGFGPDDDFEYLELAEGHGSGGPVVCFNWSQTLWHEGSKAWTIFPTTQSLVAVTIGGDVY